MVKARRANEAGPTATAFLAGDGLSAFVLEAAILGPEIGVTLYAAGALAQARRLFLGLARLGVKFAFDYIREGDEWFRREPQNLAIESPTGRRVASRRLRYLAALMACPSAGVDARGDPGRRPTGFSPRLVCATATSRTGTENWCPSSRW